MLEKSMAFYDTKMLLYTQSQPKIIGNKQQVSTSIHKIYPYKLYKCMSIHQYFYLGFSSTPPYTNIWQNGLKS